MTDEQERILEMECRHYHHAATKDDAIRTELGLSPIRYYVKLNDMLDDRSVIAAEPVLTARLRRIRDTRSSQRRAG